MALTRRPAMVVSSQGNAAITRPPTFKSCTGRIEGAHAWGKVMKPVGSRIVLGAWQARCAGVDQWRSLEATAQRGLDETAPWVKSNWPGPSVVPAAKPSPSAASQSTPTFSPVSQSETARPGIFTNACRNSTFASLAISNAKSVAVACASAPRRPRSSAALSCCREAMIAADSNMSLPGPTPEQSSVRSSTAPAAFICGHADVLKSQGSPVSRHRAPKMFGETSPRFDAAKAANPRVSRSRRVAAMPLWSPETRMFELFKDVGCTANQATTASRASPDRTARTVMSSSVSPPYCARSVAGLRRYADGERLIDAFASVPRRTETACGDCRASASACAATMDMATPSTMASSVARTKPEPANWKMTCCKNPEGPECVCVPDITTLASVYAVLFSTSETRARARVFKARPTIPASRETNAARLPPSSTKTKARLKSRVCRPVPF
mmetsp:Transcript_21143/g.72946  ORF Transcript_21143/g.72946 Transcript_21143/m.72946 type:complete len:441 (-) Transcript_21143:166-1488(-)